MDEIEFRRRAYTNPFDADADFVDAVESNSEYKSWLQELQAFDAQITDIANEIPIPEGLAERIKYRQKKEPGSMNLSPRRYLAIAASVIIAVGATVSLTLYNSRPTAEDIAFGDVVLQHLYAEAAFLDSNFDVNFQQANQVMEVIGAKFDDNTTIRNLIIKFANDCLVIPLNESVHFIVEGSNGPVTFIIINNNPVSTEFNLDDGRFSGKVIPIENGNLVIVGEKDEPLERFRNLINENVEWVI